MTVEASPAATAEAAPLLTEQADGVLTITLNRPAVLNALNGALLDSLAETLGRAGADASVRALVITGGGRGFSSGADLKAGVAAGDLDIRSLLHQHYVPVITAMRSIEKPVIAAVNGVAAGAGFSLALAADLRLAGESATFVQAFVRIGLVPDAGSTFFLPALVGYARAAELMMLGETIDASRAYELGIVNRVVPDSELLAAAQEVAGRLARGPRSVGLIKRLLSYTFDADHDLERQLAHEGETQAEAAATADFLEGVAAFLEKRPARFSGR
jgi:2-(1,2-epoxy-1,2-dihydrophenyl)acetyl-CoA isomerase